MEYNFHHEKQDFKLTLGKLKLPKKFVQKIQNFVLENHIDPIGHFYILQDL